MKKALLILSVLAISIFSLTGCNDDSELNKYQREVEDFYKEIEPTDDVIFIMIHDHYRRMFLEYHCILDIYVLPQYKLKNKELIYYDYNSKIKNFFPFLLLGIFYILNRMSS